MAVQKIAKGDISELKAFKNPPRKVIQVLEAVSILLGQYSGKKNDWASIKKVLNQDLIVNILNFDKDHVPHKSMQMIAPLTANGEFEHENVAPVS